MEYELDKEMDSLLRHEARRGLFVAETGQAHLDADEISAFAENALPQMARNRATEHLADCDGCRKSLANMIRLNSEAESETIHIENAKLVTTEPDNSWFKRLFAFPKVTFAMTAMMLLMTGAIAFVALRSLNENNASVAKLEPQEEKASNMDSVASNTSVELKESANSAPANAPANSSANAAAPTANTAATPASIDALPKSDDQGQQSQQRGGPLGTPGDNDSSTLKDKAITNAPVNPVTTDGLLKSEPAPATKPITEADEKLRANEQENKNLGRDNNYGNIDQNQIQNNRGMSPDTQNSKRAPQPPPAPVARAQNEAAKEEDRERRDSSAQGGERSAPAKKKDASETRSVGGKTFRNTGGIWTDSAYKGGGTTSVRRGSEDYKKLDSGLQSIGNSFGGTVIVVWGGRAYRIQ